jgi:heat shock protein HtpX
MLTWIKRIGYFLMTNFLIMLTITLILRITGLDQWMYANGGNYQGMMVFCLLWGMVGSFISLWLSKFMAKRAYGVKIVDQSDPRFASLVNRVHSLARAAGLPKLPEVGVYESPELNAFATGPSKSNSLVAVSTGLLNSMSDTELDGVLAHEIAHITNGDMVTMTLIQGVVNAFVMFLANIITSVISNAMRGDRDSNRGGSFFGNYFLYMAIQSVLGFFGMMVVAYFSRAREFRADAGGARLSGKQNMIAALESLQRHFGTQQRIKPTKAQQSLNAFKISTSGGVMALLSTHPPLERRLESLRNSL